MPFVQCNDISVYYETYGAGEPLILISGLGGDHSFWQDSIEVLSASFQVIVFDTRGIGKTDAPQATYSMEQFADDLVALMDALHITRANVLGFSMGGNIALTFAVRYPARVLKLIVAASYAVMNKQARLFLDAVLSVYEDGASPKQMFDLIAPWLFSANFLADPANAAYLYYDENEPDQQPLYAWKNQYLAQQRYNLMASLGEIRVPTLLLAGENDRLAHPEDSKLLAERIAGSMLAIIPGAGHLINYEYPELFHQHIAQFLGNNELYSEG